MEPRTSLFLDLSRFSAALVVLFHHLLTPPFHDIQIAVPGRNAVVVFFVVSGYVIAYVTETKENVWQVHLTNRLTRLYSVVLPAMALTATLFAVGNLAALPLYEPIDFPVIRVLISLAFMNEWWNLTVQALNNGPFWSLCYEFWYYVVYGAFIFSPPGRRWPIAIGLLLFAGPRIALLFPIWLLGVLTYRLRKRFRFERVPGASLLFLIAVAYSLNAFWLGTPFDRLALEFKNSLADGYLTTGWPGVAIFIGSDWSFLRDYWLGLMFATAILFSGSKANVIPHASLLASVIRHAASYTFSLYLYHAPFLVFITALALKFHGAVPGTWMLATSTLFAVWALGSATEHRTAALRRLVAGVLTQPQSRAPNP